MRQEQTRSRYDVGSVITIRPASSGSVANRADIENHLHTDTLIRRVSAMLPTQLHRVAAIAAATMIGTGVMVNDSVTPTGQVRPAQPEQISDFKKHYGDDYWISLAAPSDTQRLRDLNNDGVIGDVIVPHSPITATDPLISDLALQGNHDALLNIAQWSEDLTVKTHIISSIIIPNGSAIEKFQAARLLPVQTSHGDLAEMRGDLLLESISLANPTEIQQIAKVFIEEDLGADLDSVLMKHISLQGQYSLVAAALNADHLISDPERQKHALKQVLASSSPQMLVNLARDIEQWGIPSDSLKAANEFIPQSLLSSGDNIALIDYARIVFTSPHHNQLALDDVVGRVMTHDAPLHEWFYLGAALEKALDIDTFRKIEHRILDEGTPSDYVAWAEMTSRSNLSDIRDYLAFNGRNKESDLLSRFQAVLDSRARDHFIDETLSRREFDPLVMNIRPNNPELKDTLSM